MSVFIIAEIGLNHNGNIATALNLAQAAKLAGADAVKFQTFFGKFSDLKKYEFNKEEWAWLFTRCEDIGIIWMSTPFDRESIIFLDELGMRFWKIPSGMITNLRYLERIDRYILPNDRRIFMSTGMANLSEVREALLYIDKKKTTLLHCHTEYPTDMDYVNLRAMGVMEKYFCLPVGLSDHTLGIHIPVAAVALGAVVIEKHITQNRKQRGPDHQASLEPVEFLIMVNAIRDVEKAMGDGIKEPTSREMKVRAEIRTRMEGL